MKNKDKERKDKELKDKELEKVVAGRRIAWHEGPPPPDDEEGPEVISVERMDEKPKPLH